MTDWRDDFVGRAVPVDPYPKYEQRADARRAEEQRARHLRELDELQEATRDVQRATLEVHAVVKELAAETSRAQRLAVWVGVGTAILGAVIGGFAGAVAAKLVGS
jgi:hypothetical protein